MFKLVILLMMKSTAGHTMEVNVSGFNSIEDCNKAKVEIVEKSVGWGREAKILDKAPNRIMAVYCEKKK